MRSLSAICEGFMFYLVTRIFSNFSIKSLSFISQIPAFIFMKSLNLNLKRYEL